MSKTDLMSDVVGPSDISGDLQGTSKQSNWDITKKLKITNSERNTFQPISAFDHYYPPTMAILLPLAS